MNPLLQLYSALDPGVVPPTLTEPYLGSLSEGQLIAVGGGGGGKILVIVMLMIFAVTDSDFVYMHAENKISYRKGKVYLLCFCMFEIRWFLWLTFTNRSRVGPSYASCLGVEDTNGPSLSNEHKTVVAREFHCCTDGIGSLLR